MSEGMQESEEAALECHACHRLAEDLYCCDDCGLGFCDECINIFEVGEDFSEDACFCQRCLFDEEA
jgi:hypothetical protein